MMRTATGFEVLESKLAKIDSGESISPILHHVRSLYELGQSFRAALLDQGPDYRVIIVSDGVPKCSGSNGQLNLDAQVLGLLPFTQVNSLMACPENGYPESLSLATMEACKRLSAELGCQKPDLVIALGSGSLTDLCKHAVYQSLGAETCFWVVPTALTVTAFTSAFAVLERDGHKSTFPSQLPQRTFFCDEILSAAPLDLQRAGIGDLAAGFVSYADWTLAHSLGLEMKFEPQAVSLMTDMQQRLIRSPGETPLNLQSADSVAIVSELIAAAGIAMNLGGSSAPQSGGEHAVSHVLDLLRTLHSRSKWPHGLQVALASSASCGIYDWLLEQEFIPFNRLLTLSPEDSTTIARQAFYDALFSGDPSICEDQIRKNRFIEERREALQHECDAIERIAAQKSQSWQEIRKRFGRFQQDWPVLREELRCLTLTQLKFFDLLRNWDLPECPEDMPIPGYHAELRAALRLSVFFRERFGIADFAFWLGEDPAIVSAV